MQRSSRALADVACESQLLMNRSNIRGAIDVQVESLLQFVQALKKSFISKRAGRLDVALSIVMDCVVNNSCVSSSRSLIF
jgi:hypothetical protein